MYSWYNFELMYLEFPCAQHQLESVNIFEELVVICRWVDINELKMILSALNKILDLSIQNA